MSSISSLKTPKYILLADQLREQIEQGALKPGDRLPSFVEMRDQHGVTSATVERIYKHLEKDRLVVREQGRGTFVKQNAERIRTGVIGIRGLTFSQHPYFIQVMEGLQKVAVKADIELLLLNDEAPISFEKVDGVLFCDTGFNSREMEKDVPRGMPCVTTLVNARNFVSVIGDEYQGSYDLTQHLVELGHRRIAYMYDPFPPRLTGYQNALRDADITLDEQWMRTAAFYQTPDRNYISSGHAVMSSWLEEGWGELGCTALMTQNDDTAIGVIRALTEAGWRVPDQVSVTGFDGTEMGRYFHPKLTSVQVPLCEIGAAAMELLIRQIGGENIRASTIVLPTRVVEGDSTAKFSWKENHNATT